MQLQTNPQPSVFTGAGTTAPRADMQPILALYRSRKDHALNFYQTFFARIARRYDMYRGFYRGQFSASRNNIHIPFAFALIQSNVARKVQVCFGQKPYVEFEGTDPAIARKNSALITQQMMDSHTFTKAVDFFLLGDMYGTAIARDGWKTIQRKEQWRELEHPQFGAPQEVIKSGNVVRFDGPDWDVVDILDFWPQPGRRALRDCQWAMERYFLDIAEVEMYASVGRFDRGAVEILKAQGQAPPDVENQYILRYNVYRSQQDSEARRQEKFAKAVQLVDMVGYVPDEFAPDGFNFRLLTVANDRVVLRNRPFPFWHGELPYHVYTPMRDPHYLHGIGRIETIEKMQYLVNRYANQRADAMDQLVDHKWLVNTLSGIDEQTLISRPGMVIHVDGPVDDSMIKPLIPDLRGMALVLEDREVLWRHMQQTTGDIEDVTMGGSPTANRETATSFSGRSEQALSRHMLEARLAEQDFVEPMANRYRMLNRQFLQVPKELKIIGDDAVINPITGLPIPQEPQVVDLADINPDYIARAQGATQMLGKNIRKQDLMALLQVIQTNPVAIQVINWAAFLRYTFRTFDFPNVKEFMVQQQVPAVNQLGAETGMGAEGVAGSALSAGDLSPSLGLSRLLGVGGMA